MAREQQEYDHGSAAHAVVPASAVTARRTHIALEHVLRFLAYGKRRGAPVDSMLAFYGVDLRRDTLKPGYVPGHIWETIIVVGIEWCKRAGDPLAGIGAAVGLGSSFLGLWSYIAEKSDTLGKAIDTAAAYRKLHADTLDVEIRRHPGYLDILITPIFRNAEACAHTADFYLVQLDRFVQQCTGESQGVIESVHVRHAAPDSPALRKRYEEEFGCPVRFGAPENLLRIPASALNLPLVTADAMLQGALESHARDQLAVFDRQTEDLVNRAKRHLRVLIATGRASRESLAACLEMNPRTLLRKLQASGTTYRQLCHEIRLELSLNYLAQPLLPLAFIANHLGFRDPQSFSRWFIDQTGEPPSAYRCRIAQPE